ncbi:DsbA family protein [Cellulomonas palmilytica]|uniref:DsbA family protein n=1 Tax=Cellulomonas palmilytica TaxID=2608402 RepID=UPI000A43844E|nr:hypothetical protein [Cellulomonas palmilytica]UJP38889.1 hypothetical protein F1D97_10890 [Cellulomonas palmilytica]
MSHARSAKAKAARKQRLAIDRQLAEIERARRARRARLRRIGLRAGAVVGCAALVGAVVVTAQSRARAAAIGPANMVSDGVVVSGDGSTLSTVRTAALEPDDVPSPYVTDPGVLPVVAFVDYRDPMAATWWSMNREQVTEWVTDGNATFEIRPLALLDGTDVLATPVPTPTSTAGSVDQAADTRSAQPTDGPTTIATTGDYSVRAAGALACVAEHSPDLVLATHTALLDEVPTLPADGLSTDELASLVSRAGAGDAAVQCVRHGDHTDWARAATERAAGYVPFGVATVTTSPVIIVGGQPYRGDLADTDAFARAFTDAFGALVDPDDPTRTMADREAAEAEPTPTSTAAAEEPAGTSSDEDVEASDDGEAPTS